MSFFSFIQQSDVYTFDEIKDSLQTGDILLFNGEGMFSLLTQIATFSPWSHVGTVIRCEHMKTSYSGKWKKERTVKNNKKDCLYLWHSNASELSIPDAITNQVKKGVQLTPLEVALRLYRGNVFVRRLVHKIDGIGCRRECTEKFHNFMRETVLKPYTQDISRLFYAAYDGPFGENEDKDGDGGYFCSELTAKTCKELGLFFDDIICSEFVPSDFARMQKTDNENWELDDKKQIVANKK